MFDFVHVIHLVYVSGYLQPRHIVCHTPTNQQGPDEILTVKELVY